MEVHKSANSYEEWVFEGGGWKKKKMMAPSIEATAVSDTVDFNTPAVSRNVSTSNASRNVAKPRTSQGQSQLKSLKERLPWKRNSGATTAGSAAPSNFSYSSSVVTPKKSNPNPNRNNTNAKSRFNPTFPFTSSKHAATDTPDTVGMATPDTDESDDGDEHEHVTCTVPATNIRMIQAAYGENANLYTEVLQVETEFAKEQEIRIAYFRRGRQVLAQQQQEKQQLQQGDTSVGTIADLSLVAKQRFQAVSMAYEILSQPSSKQLYDRVGLKRLLKYAQEADAENDDVSVPKGVYANTTSPILRRRNSFEDRTGSSTERLDLTRTTSGRTPPSTVARTTVDSVEVSPHESSAAIRWSEDVEELVYDQEPEERAFKTGKPVIVAQGCDDDESYEDFTPVKRNGRRQVVATSQTDFYKNLERLDHATEFSANVYLDKFLDDVDASLDNIEVGFDDLIKYVTDDEAEVDEEEAEVQQPKPQKAKAPPKPEVNRFKTVTLTKPKRKTTSSRVLAYLNAAKKIPQDEDEGENENEMDRSPDSRENSPISNDDDDASEDISQDADDLFVTLMKAPAFKKDEPIVLSRGHAENQFLEKARSQSTSALNQKKLTPFPKSVGLGRLTEDQELGESFLPHFQSDTPAGGPTNMMIRTKSKKSLRKLSGSDSISAITETTNMPQPRVRKESKLTDCVPALALPAAVGLDGFPLVKPEICLNTTLGSDPFSGVEDDTAMNTTTISDSGANMDFTAYFLAYMNNLTKDMYDIGNRVNTSIYATNKMFYDSIVISEDDMMGMLEHFNHDNEEDQMCITRSQTF
jgi:curved DNA-binding protein CbpA